VARRRPRLNYANVVATLALFLALAGGAVAATQIPDGSVGTRQLKADAVTPAKLSRSAKKTMTGPQGLKGEPGAKGADGQKGDRGETGPRGPSDAYSIADNSASALGPKQIELSVPPGSYVVEASMVAIVPSGYGTVECELFSAAGTAGVAAVTIPASPVVPAEDTYGDPSIDGALTVTSGDPIKFGCVEGSGTGTIKFAGAQIVATRVGTLTES
jgi:hypothetical protein